MGSARRARCSAVAGVSGALIGAGAVGAVASPSAVPSREVQAKRTIVAFVRAFNRHDAQAALSFFTADPRFVRFVGANDCDFRRGVTVGYPGRAEVRKWLRQRAADRDRVTLASIRLLAARETRAAGAAVTFSRRSSDTLTALGYPEGVGPRGAKIGFTTSGPLRITQFAGAAGTGQPCSP